MAWEENYSGFWEEFYERQNTALYYIEKYDEQWLRNKINFIINENEFNNEYLELVTNIVNSKNTLSKKQKLCLTYYLIDYNEYMF